MCFYYGKIDLQEMAIVVYLSIPLYRERMEYRIRGLYPSSYHHHHHYPLTCNCNSTYYVG